MLSALTVVNTSEWEWLGKSRRHHVRFVHNTLTGKQQLFVDGAEFFSSGWKFKLTGSIYLPVDDATVELYLRSDGAPWAQRRSRPTPR